MNKEEAEKITEQVKATQRLIDNAVLAERKRCVEIARRSPAPKSSIKDEGDQAAYDILSQYGEHIAEAIQKDN